MFRFRAGRHLLRLAAIARIFARHDAMFFAEEIPGLPASARMADRKTHV